MMAGDLWVFGYGSLMWRPDFDYVERSAARLDGYHRCFCISSTHHRGSAARPGLVLGLDRGGSCEGVAYRVVAAQAHAVWTYLRRRELISGVYREMMVPVSLGGAAGRQVRALAYIVERAHPSYVGEQPLRRQAQLIRGARGVSGDNLDYLVNTVCHLQHVGVRERALERLVAMAGAHVPHLTALKTHDGLSHASVTGIRRTAARTPVEVRRMRPGDRKRFLYRLRLGGG